MIRRDGADGAIRLWLDHAARGNALSAELVEALLAQFESACNDPAVHTVVFDSTSRNFCTGFDLSELDTQSDGDLLLRFTRIETLLAAVWHAPIRTVCVGAGRTWGAGADLFAACDHRIALDDATLRFPGAGFGLVLGTRRLAERVGTQCARTLTCDGLTLDAQAALRVGLAGQVCHREQLDEVLAPLMQAPLPDRATIAALRAASRADQRDADMAALVRSASAPGLKGRIEAYRKGVLAARG